MALEIGDARLGVVEDRGGEGRVGVAGREHLGEVVERAGAPRGDHRNVHGVRYGGGHLVVEPGARAVTVHRRQQDLAGAVCLGLPRPLDGVAVGVGRAAAHEDGEVVATPLGVDRHDHRLAAVAPGERGDERRVLERRRVEAHLVGAGFDRRVGILLGSDAATDSQRQEDLPGHRADRARHGLALLERGGDVENHHLVDAFHVVAAGQLARVAGVAQSLELHAFHHLPVAHVEAGDDALGQHQAASRTIPRKLRRICRPASLDFSGWNCTPKTFPSSTAEAKVLACVVAAAHALVTGAANECVK